MAINIVAYAGILSFDIILYQSRILHQLGRKVLVVDNSDTKALVYSLPHIPGVDTDNSFVTYRCVDFTTQAVTHAIAKQYDDILIDFGHNPPQMDLSLLTRVVFIVDMFEYNMAKIAESGIFDQVSDKALLIRDATEAKITTEHILSKINKEIPKDMVYFLYRDDRDFDNCLRCHFNQVTRFTHISQMLQQYLIMETKILYGEIGEKQMRQAYNKARRGE